MAPLYALYGVVSYVVFLGSFLYVIGFLGDFAVPATVDGPVRVAPGQALLVDALVLGLFAIQHSVMARPAFKRWWTRVVPAPIERSTYVLVSSLLLFLVYAQWQPIAGTVWDERGTTAGLLLEALRWTGWLTVLVSTFLISHFELFGLRQVWQAWLGRELPAAQFRKVFLYRLVRHPIMLGFVIAFWATPWMTVGHVLFAGLACGYIVVGLALEERDLLAAFGATYQRYRDEVPMLIPFLRLRQGPAGAAKPAAKPAD
jgi:protein-S-isoprenylcysteine O-methyltransferase Ste14